GGLGWGVGAALGAKLAKPDHTIICTVGDGAYIFGAPTAAHWVARAYDIPVLWIVFNNRAWNAVKRAVTSPAPDGWAKRTGMPLVDADGPVTESNEQVAKYLDQPYRRRPLTFPLYPQDGWDRRLLGTLGSVGGTAEQWLKALDDGGMETTVLYPTLGLFLSFLKDRAWAVAICRAYNTFLHEEFITKSPRLQAVALLPLQDPEA